jgi:hypothetical protein
MTSFKLESIGMAFNDKGITFGFVAILSKGRYNAFAFF